ncbi:MAG: PD40 domain-containing protein [Planctomycetes bacterium]|nr:PD40 domain-containing protein [Planctomycetota bacterium]
MNSCRERGRAGQNRRQQARSTCGWQTGRSAGETPAPRWSQIAWMLALWLSIGTGLVQADEQLTTDGRIKYSPIFADRAGAEIVYVLQERAVQFRLLRMKLADRSVTVVHPEQTKTEFEPALSPDGQVLAYIQSRGNLSLALMIHDSRTGKAAEVPPGGGFSGPRSPAISPDGTRILFSYPEQGRQRIYSVNTEAKDQQILIDSDGVNNWPDFSPDGQRIVFASTRDDDYEIYTAAANGQDVRRLTFSPRQDVRPRFSPDGTRIAFMSSRDGNYEIYVMQADGSHVQRVTSNPESDDYPAWHPDGKQLLIISERNGRHDLYLIPVPAAE